MSNGPTCVAFTLQRRMSHLHMTINEIIFLDENNSKKRQKFLKMNHLSQKIQ